MDLAGALRLRLDPDAPDVVSLVGGGGKTSAMRRLAAEAVARDKRVICTATTRLASYEVEATAWAVEITGAELPLDAIAAALDRHGQCLLISPHVIEGEGRKYPGVSAAQVDALAVQAAKLGASALIVEADGSRMLPAKAPAEYEPPVPSSTTLLVAVAGMDAVGRQIEEDRVHRPERIRSVLGLGATEPARLTPEMVARLLAHPHGGGKNRPPGATLVALLNKAETAPARACARLAARRLAADGHMALIASAGHMDGPPVHERWGPLAAVILAAGEGSRLGRPKQVAEVGGEPLVVRALRRALQSDAGEIVVVTGAHAQQTAQALAPWTAQPALRVRVVHNAAWASGQASSMQAGLAALSPATQAALLLPVDQPFLPVSLLRRLESLWRAGWPIAAPRVDGELRGAPALFDRALWPELHAVRGDRGGRDVLRRRRYATGAVDVDGELLADIDAPDDLAAVRGRA